jgi:hypothetical protein
MRYAIQTINGRVEHDFSLTLIEALRYQKWMSDDPTPKNYMLVDYNDVEYLSGKDIVPVGSVEFVTHYLSIFYDKTPTPRNVPSVLFPYAGRQIRNTRDVSTIQPPCYVKSNTHIKSQHNGVYKEELPVDKYQVSSLVEIDSEWRAFVFNQRLVGLQNYLGDFTIFPDVNKIKEIINAFNYRHKAYTIDVWINYTGTYLMEIHDFFSVGFYGFNDLRVIPQMFSQWFFAYVNDWV